jgi:hypothetical protein
MLTEIQVRLDQHFLSLSRQRAELGYPIYALEHGLDSSEIHAVRATGMTLENGWRRTAPTLSAPRSVGFPEN